MANTAPQPAAALSVFTLYRDPAAAVQWLERALGLATVARFDDPATGALVHAELRLGDAVLVVQQAAPGHSAAPVHEHSTCRAPVLSLGDDAAVDALFDRARAAGATVLRPPETTAWGNHRFEVLDPEGHQWSVGTYRPGAGW